MTAEQALRDDPRRARRRRPAIIVVAAVVVALLLALAWLAVRGLHAKDELGSAVAASHELTSAVRDGDEAGAEAAVERLSRHSAAAASVSADPVWRAVELLPWLGANLTAVRVAAEQTHLLATDVAAPLVDLSAKISTREDAAGALLDVNALADGHRALTRADTVLQGAGEALHGLGADALIPPVSDGVGQLTDVVAQAEPLVAALADASAIVPTMLGAEEPRTILVMLQNNAELRSAGGITGTFIAIHAENGILSIGRQTDSADFRVREKEILPVPASTVELYGTVAGRYVQDTSITPDFTLTARLAAAWWKDLTGTTPDTVVSVDPLVLQAVLRVIGPVSASIGDVTADNMAQKLLVEPYLTLSSERQTAVFDEVIRGVFRLLTTSDSDPVALAGALATPVDEGRISVWSAHVEEEAVLETTALAGAAARQRAEGPEAYAVYFNDTTGGKMDSFLATEISSGVGACRSDGKRTVEVAVKLTSTAPADAGRRFPDTMTGGDRYGIVPGHIGTTVAVSAPPGAFVGGVTRDGALVGQVDAEDAGFMVSAYSVDLAPGESTTLVFRFDTSNTTDITPTILHTPMLTPPDITTREVDCG
jgi:hypothetical protein